MIIFITVLGVPSSSPGRMDTSPAKNHEYLSAEHGLYRSAVPEEFQERKVVDLPHIQLYRQVQNNWICFDAYTRISMLCGVTQICNALSYFCLGHIVVNMKAIMAAIICVIFFTSIIMLLMKIDLALPTRDEAKLMFFICLGPFSATLAVVIQYFDDDAENTWLQNGKKCITQNAILFFPCIFQVH